MSSRGAAVKNKRSLFSHVDLWEACAKVKQCGVPPVVEQISDDPFLSIRGLAMWAISPLEGAKFGSSICSNHFRHQERRDGMYTHDQHNAQQYAANEDDFDEVNAMAR
jgi:hypothetical protein